MCLCTMRSSTPRFQNGYIMLILMIATISLLSSFHITKDIFSQITNENESMGNVMGRNKRIETENEPNRMDSNSEEMENGPIDIISNIVLSSPNSDNEPSPDETKLKIPTFIVAGTQKGGTEALLKYLKKHREIVPSSRYEPHWFDKVSSRHEYANGTLPESAVVNYARKYRDYAFDATQYKKRKNPERFELKGHPERITFEKTPLYMFVPKAAHRIKSTLPHTKIIFLLRDPVERAYSHYKFIKSRMMKRFKNKNLRDKHLDHRFEDFIQKDLRALQSTGVIPFDKNDPLALVKLDEAWERYTKLKMDRGASAWDAVIGRGLYVAQLRVWWKVYGEQRKEKILVVKSEDMRPKEDGYIHLKDIFDFIGITGGKIKHKRKIHHTDGSPMREVTKIKLRRFYSNFSDALEELLESKVWQDPFSWNESLAKN
uniref:Sulfotransferase domain-containing protein n=1 Tax=Ditylum brightwellii TaxID=49249 RepID=A0A7S2A584_9STRA|mmetsp:Transcript_8959/g.13322  ORF Transcript_8959/g.13322 Transcript_8959/m.13322 type:complete len:430 (+) Transcript_8959:74-1363(+)